MSTIAFFAVHVNYNMMDYLPDDSPSMEATDLMEEEFDEPIGNTRVMVEDVTIPESLAYKEALENIEGVSHITWLDDVLDLKTPLEMADTDTVEQYYQSGAALFSLTVDEGYEVEAMNAIYDLIGEENAADGEAADTAMSQEMADREAMYAAALLIPIIIIILILSTNSWVEPLFFLTAIGISVIINLGTNIFLGEISFVTQSVAPILQLAVSLDYAIFLLHSFSDYRKKVPDPTEAMRLAMKRSFPAIAASATTTFFGFIALTFMNFEIGADLGLNLVKGIVFSFISVMVFLPALTLMFYKWIDKTQHKPIVPEFKNVGKRVLKLRIPTLIFVGLLIVPAFLAQSETTFIYGVGEQPDTTRLGADEIQIEEQFGENTPMVVLVPKGDVAKEEELVYELENLNNISSVMAYVNRIDPAIPSDYLDESVTESFYSENYSRITLHTDTGTEGDQAFALVEDVQKTAMDYYGDEAHLLGESVTLYDIKDTVQRDNTLVNWLTVIAVAIVLLATFRSIFFPVVLLITIQSAVWFNLSIPYFTDSTLVFVGYLIVSTVQLAATVDYGILFTENYKRLRKEMTAFEAMKRTIDEKLFAIFISAAILSSVGFILWITSSNPIVGSVGLLLGRGALLAFLSVVFLLPALLLLFDKLIEKTTIKANFYKGK
ncbi:putative RND superfamily exporter protein [Alkalibacillus filiformis]|uniref:RND superfamily exporter protein n=1 Tax=Alkalibacillus filiformis TaxID=200990 RepID=A0ABU0DPQ7_9BACI|nr:MMPL family transporter [Alkalibacillus filiformis]MDQ0350291.1 putative RND superfamily exporter protein [Alkalibacillus filiformis]